jgi:hypothetical protein
MVYLLFLRTLKNLKRMIFSLFPNTSDDLLLVFENLFGAVREDHVVKPLVGGASNHAKVHIAGQLRRILVLFVLGLERADADPLMLGKDRALDLQLLDRCR